MTRRFESEKMAGLELDWVAVFTGIQDLAQNWHKN